jgi:hypothetical protein
MFIDIVFYTIRTDTRVTSIFKLVKVIITINNIIKRFKKYERITILDKLFYELCETIWAAINNDASVEIMNLLIAEAELGDDYLIEQDLLNKIIKKCREYNKHTEKSAEKLNYFEITTILYYIKNHSNFVTQKAEIMEDAIYLLKNYSVLQYSEAAHLLLDLISAPYIDKNQKIELVSTAFKTYESSNKSNETEINRFVNFVQKESWYYNWKENINLKKILKKKEYMLSY